MTQPAKRLTKPVIFTASPEEQLLLKAIEQALKNKQFSTFSELCKQALRQLLLSSPAENQVEQRVTALENQLTQLTERLVTIEAKLSEDVPSKDEVEEEVIVDPVLDRLRPLLEDF